LTTLTKSKAVLIAFILTITFSGIGTIATAQPLEMASVIIGFNGSSDADSIRARGGTIKYSYQYIQAIAASIPSQAINLLQTIPSVAYVETDYKVTALQQQTPWGIAKIGAPTVWATGNKGTGIKVAILDTGIDTSHPDLKVLGGATFVAGTTSYNDDNGHGTHCAGIVAALNNGIGVVGVAPETALYAVKVLDSTGSGYISNIISGIEWSISNGMQVISMSFGSTFDSTSFHAECDKAYNAGIVLVAAAGNNGPGANTVIYPAKYSSVIAVGATDSNDVVASWSSRGSELSVTAPGASIYSTYKGGAYATMSGTSMACPHATGTVALILAKAAHTPAEVKAILQSTAKDLGSTGWDSTYGYGRIDAYAASIASGVQTVPSPPQNLKATAGDAKITLSWSTPSTNGGSPITGYKIYKGTASGTETFLTTLGNVLTFEDTSVTNGQTYYYKVTAVNGIGESTKSNEAYATPSSLKTLKVVVTTEKATYSRGSNARITVIVKDGTTENGLPGASVKLTVYYPSGSVAWTRTGTTDPTGTVQFTYTIGWTARKGTYKVTATASLTGYQTETGQTTFKVA